MQYSYTFFSTSRQKISSAYSTCAHFLGVLHQRYVHHRAFASILSLVLLFAFNSLFYGATRPESDIIIPNNTAAAVVFTDTDGDGVDDAIDLDDDNDGILDTDEVCFQRDSFLENYDFEEYNYYPPTGHSQLNRLKNWDEAIQATSDYLHEDGFNGGDDFNIGGTPSGKGYVGTITDGFNNYVEYVGNNLTGVLKAGVSYELDMLLGAGENGFVYGGDFNGEFVIYGFPTPQAFPLLNETPPDEADPYAIELVRQTVSINAGTWTTQQFTFTPTQDIYAIMIGGEKTINTYLFHDRLLLRENCPSGFVPVDTDGDGIINSLDLDSDNDGISDLEESGADVAAFDPDQNGVIDGSNFVDADSDGLADGLETSNGNNLGTTPRSTDTDELPNFMDLDSDDDGIPDTVEGYPTDDYMGNDGDVTNDDTDGDGVIDQFDNSPQDFGGNFIRPQNTDVLIGVNPDDLPDYIDTDSDGDGLLDSDEGGSTVTAVTYADPNGSINTPITDLPDDILGNNEVAYRESCIPQLPVFVDVLVCGDEYILPVLVEPFANYFTEPLGAGTLLNAGDTVPVTTTPAVIYVYAETGTVPNCINETSFTISQQEEPVLAPIQDVVVCETYIFPEIVGTNLTANTRYYTETNGGGTAFEPRDIITFLDFASYPITLYANDTDVTGDCSDEQSFELVLLETPVIDAITDVMECDNYTLPQISGTAITDTASYYTETNGGGTAYVPGDIIIFSDFASYPVTIYAYNAEGDCSNEQSFELALIAAPVLAPIPNVAVCDSYVLPEIAGANVTANAAYFTETNGGGTSYASGDMLSFSDFKSYPVTLYAYDSNVDCNDEQAFALVISQTPVIAPIAHVVVCDSYELPQIAGSTLTTNASYYTETNAAGTSYEAGDVIAFSDFASYPVTLYAYDTNGSTPCTDEQAFQLTLFQSPSIAAIADVTACESYTLPVIAGTNLNTTARYYTAANGGGTYYEPGDTIQFGDVASSPITLYAYDENGSIPCTSEQAFELNLLAPIVLPTPTLNFLNCAQGTTASSVEIRLNTAQITGGSSNYTSFAFVWDNNTPANTQDDVVLQEGSQATYLETDVIEKRILINVQDDAGCTASTEVTIPMRTPLTADITAIQQSVCVGDDNGSIAIAFVGGVSPYTITLVDNNGRNNRAETTRDTEYIFTGLAGGRTYDIKVADTKNCSVQLQQTLAPSVDLTAGITVNYFCAEGESQLQNTVEISIDPALSNQVIFTLDGDASTAQLSPIFNNVSPGNHTLAIAHENGCINTNSSFAIQEIAPLSLGLSTPNINTIIANTTGGGGNYQYSFNQGAFGSNNTFIIQETGTYSVRVRDGNNCETTQEVFVEFIPIIIPNYFTPTDTKGWKPLNLDNYPNAETEIFDRYGRTIKLLKVDEIWYGNYENSNLPSGDYWYILRLNSAYNSKEIIGHVTLYR